MASKVVGKDGRPLVVYHGTSRHAFEEFARRSEREDERAVKDEPCTPIGYLGHDFARHPDVSAGFAGLDESRDEGGHVYPVFLNVRRPAVYRSTEAILQHAAEQELPPSHLPSRMFEDSPAGFWDRYAKDQGFREQTNLWVWGREMERGNPSFATRLGKQFRQELRQSGHDGLIYPMPAGAVCYIVFDATDIKSAIANDGSFDSDDRSILS